MRQRDTILILDDMGNKPRDSGWTVQEGPAGG